MPADMDLRCFQKQKNTGSAVQRLMLPDSNYQTENLVVNTIYKYASRKENGPINNVLPILVNGICYV